LRGAPRVLECTGLLDVEVWIEAFSKYRKKRLAALEEVLNEEAKR